MQKEFIFQNFLTSQKMHLQPQHIETLLFLYDYQLSNVETGQYLDGCELENTRWCKLEGAGGVMELQ